MGPQHATSGSRRTPPPPAARSLGIALLDVGVGVQVVVPPVHEQHGVHLKGVRLHLHRDAVRTLVACGRGWRGLEQTMHYTRQRRPACGRDASGLGR